VKLRDHAAEYAQDGSERTQQAVELTMTVSVESAELADAAEVPSSVVPATTASAAKPAAASLQPRDQPNLAVVPALRPAKPLVRIG